MTTEILKKKYILNLKTCNMYVIIVIGGAQQGKTPFIKNYAKDNNLLVFDVQNEYGEKAKYKDIRPENLSTDNTKPRSRIIDLDVNKFIDACTTKVNTICVFEEATMFFQGVTNDRMRKLIFSKAHTRNVYVLVFHSINSVPPRIMESSDYVVLFKTADEAHTVERKYPRLLKAYIKLQGAKQGSNIKIKMI